MSETNLFSVTHSALQNRLRRTVAHSVATLKATPEDKLDYKPTDTAKSVRELSQHSVLGNNYCLQAFGIEVQGDVNVTTVPELVTELEKTGNALIDFASGCDESALVKEVNFFGGPISTVQMLMTTEWHLSRHSGQIDYLQTTWDDQEDRY
jgi:hypothetical protein